MSVRLIGLVFDHYPTGGSERLLALALVDHADHDGENIYPSVALLARKAMLSRRTVQEILKRMRGSDWLQLVSEAARQGGNQARFRRGRTYRINPHWIADPANFRFNRIGGADSAQAQSEAGWGRNPEHFASAVATAPESKTNRQKENRVIEGRKDACRTTPDGKECGKRGVFEERGRWWCRECLDLWRSTR